MVDPDGLPTTDVDRLVYRIVLARYPQINLFERVASAEHWDILYAIESLTNPRIRQEVGDISMVPVEDRVFGAGASWIMAAFTHVPGAGEGGRFNADFGTYYCAPDEATAVAETSYHRARFLRESRISDLVFAMRVLRAHLGPTELHDVRDVADADIYHRDDYTQSQRLGAALRARDSVGIYYASVRCAGDCMAVMKPVVLTNAIHLKYLNYTYKDGAIVDVSPLIA